MKNRIVLLSGIAVAIIASAGLGFRAYANHRDVTLRATLRGLNEVPPIATPATATLRATLDESAQTITFTLEFRDLTANPAAAHIHFGPPGVNGGVMVFFCGGGGKPACPASTAGTVTGTIAATDVVGPAAQGIAAGDFASVVRAIRTGNSYANMHNERFPSGELRGKVIASGFDDGDHDGDD
ncbi:MAG TPA: CHRD domain-containing protein [Kofleriaceae bacterium]|nr:CHRD domain-containing protein [Kofleriaceae bacterium]